MHTPENRPADPAKLERIIGAIRIFGALLLMAAILLALDAGSFASSLGLDSLTRQVLAAMCALMGIADFFVVPAILRRSQKDHDKAL